MEFDMVLSEFHILFLTCFSTFPLSSLCSLRHLFYHKRKFNGACGSKVGNWVQQEAIRMIKVALLCANPSPALGPTMSAIVSMLKGQTVAPELTMDPGIYSDDMKFNALRGQYDQMQLESYSTCEPLNNEWIFLTSILTHIDLVMVRKFSWWSVEGLI